MKRKSKSNIRVQAYHDMMQLMTTYQYRKIVSEELECEQYKTSVGDLNWLTAVYLLRYVPTGYTYIKNNICR